MSQTSETSIHVPSGGPGGPVLGLHTTGRGFSRTSSHGSRPVDQQSFHLGLVGPVSPAVVVILAPVIPVVPV